MVFGNYAKYYDLLYQDKNYKQEIDFIISLIKQYSPKEKLRILDIGCGTGIHANYLASQGYEVTGIDFSEDMIQIAKEKGIKNTNFYVADARFFNLNMKFDVILSLFHVVSYQTSNKDILSMFFNVSKHLKSDGLFIFDFWYGPAVLTERPTIKIKRFESDGIKAVRIAEPVMNTTKNTVDVNYEIIVSSQTYKQVEFINEVHKMRYFFIPEIDNFLEETNMVVQNYGEWLTSLEPSNHTWGVYCITKLNENK
jgi:SAM-dependent methyltransferase